MLGNTVCTAQEWRSRLCLGDVVDSDNRSQLPGFSRAAVYNGGEDPVRMGVPDNLQVDGGATDTGCLHSGSVGGSRCGPSGMDTGGYRRIRQSGLIVRPTGLGPVTRASGPATNKIFNFVQGKPKRSGAP